MKLSGKLFILYPLMLPLFMSCMTATPVKTTVPSNKTAVRQAIINEGAKHINKPYSSPPHVPNSFDCSSFVNYVYTKTANMPLSTSTKAYAALGREIDFKDAKPGDVLVFTSQPGGSTIDHVAILYKKSASGGLRGSLLVHAVSIPIQSAAIKGNPNKPGVVIGELGKRGDGNWKNEYFLSRYKCTKRFIDG